VSHTPPSLPKPASGALKELWEDCKRTLDLPRTVLVLEGALDRKALEEILQRLMKGAAARPGQMPRAELVGRLADAFHNNLDAAFALMKELDKSCHKERHIVASIDEASVDERLSTYRALDFRRERARLVWALLRDGRPVPMLAADKILVDAFAQIKKAADAHAAAETVGAPDGSELKHRLTSYEKAIEQQQQQLQREVSLKETSERERSELMARLGQRERALRQEEELRRNLEAEHAKLKDELRALQRNADERAGAASHSPAAVEELERLREKNRALEHKAGRVERITALEEEVDGLRKAHDVDRRTWTKAREEIEGQLREVTMRERSAHDRVSSLRDELKAARRQLAGAADDGSAEPRAARTGVFVDAANLSASARRDFGSKLDYRALLVEVLDGRPKACAVAYLVRDGDEGPYLGFTGSLRDAGYDIREKRPKQRSDGSRKADWDMGIAMEILDAIGSLDVVVLCSGDGDFLPLVKRLQREGKRVEVAAFRAATDEALMKGADAFVPLDGRFRM
jgi:uncharacterized LabA/DUF88 family protein